MQLHLICLKLNKRLLEARKSEIIEKLGLSDAMSLHKLRYMTPEQIDKAADLK